MAMQLRLGDYFNSRFRLKLKRFSEVSIRKCSAKFWAIFGPILEIQKAAEGFIVFSFSSKKSWTCDAAKFKSKMWLC